MDRYLAPEIILNRGHNQAADWWAVGILCYEMIMGRSPFVDANDPMQTYQKALRGELPTIEQPPAGKKGGPITKAISLYLP